MKSEVHVKPYTKQFIDRWIALARLLPPSNSEFDDCVERQERANKKTRARLRPGNYDEQIRGWIGISSLSYRLPQAWQIVNDIDRAERGEADSSAGF